ncbi:15-hydroxyprostaglandin dehydrogenase [NAD(+)]-like [Pararge aegeria]|uniref:15-hydroxyprostaglandin dehydrogenase [NAD(+)] n=1 Tax=Pararge aegeria aegeria TaxID=348720 RepID=A0A8S4RGX1_9NEOP|nr:15-hydroxyprostaglandin dehydrogenase [NAD(+)]-like [Pararge aegeria]CAH2236021.1 jg7313 [Pararge aegeria aegeria]
MAQDGKIEGKTFLITGGASGLGAAYVEAFLTFGAEKIAILDVAEKVGKDFAEKLNETYKNKVLFIRCDVSKEEDIKNSFQEVLTAFERIDVIINNAGIMNDSIDAWRTASDVNWQGLVSFTRKGISHMRKDEGGLGGSIINISSTAALVKLDILPVYCGSKAAVLHFSRSISSPEFYDNTGVRILTICFGPTSTPLLSNLQSKFLDQKVSQLFCASSDYPYQSVETAVEAFLKMFREGDPGSVWLSTCSKPVQDITSILDDANKPLQMLLLPEGVTNVSK